jgi:hypothetical protein
MLNARACAHVVWVRSPHRHGKALLLALLRAVRGSFEGRALLWRGWLRDFRAAVLHTFPAIAAQTVFRGVAAG